jgi:hypothetical protein
MFTTLTEAEAGALNNRREKLFEVYGDALKKTLIVADNLQAVAISLQSAIDRLIEVDAAMVGCLKESPSWRRNIIC